MQEGEDQGAILITYSCEVGEPVGKRLVSPNESIADPRLVEFGCGVEIAKLPGWDAVEDVDIWNSEGKISLNIPLRFPFGTETDPFMVALTVQGLSRHLDELHRILEDELSSCTQEGERHSVDWKWEEYENCLTLVLLVEANHYTTFGQVLRVCARFDEVSRDVLARAQELSVGVERVAPAKKK